MKKLTEEQKQKAIIRRREYLRVYRRAHYKTPPRKYPELTISEIAQMNVRKRWSA